MGFRTPVADPPESFGRVTSGRIGAWRPAPARPVVEPRPHVPGCPGRAAGGRSRWQIAQCALAAGVGVAASPATCSVTRPRSSPRSRRWSASARRTASGCAGSRGDHRRRDRRVRRRPVRGRSSAPGWWQLTLIVALAMSTAFLLDGGQLFVTQAAVQSIVVATLVPDPGAALTRWTDALIGGGVALVAATVVPAAPLRRPREQAAVVVRKVASLLRAAGDIMVDGEVEPRPRPARRRPVHRPPDPRAPGRRRRGARRWSPPRRSGCATRGRCVGWSTSSTRSTGRCAAPGCWSGRQR